MSEVVVPGGETSFSLGCLVSLAVRDVGACVVRLWSHVVAPVFRELRCLSRCVSMFCFRLLEFLLLYLLFKFIAYLIGLNSNPSRSLDPWVAARPSGVPGGGPGGRVVTVVSEIRGPKRFVATSRAFRILMDHVCVMIVVAIVRPVWFGRVVGAGFVLKQDRTCCSWLGIDGQVWSFTGLTSIEGDANLMNLTSGFVDVYGDGSLNGIRVDANLCDLQNIGLPEDSFLTPFSLSFTLFSRPLLPHYFQQFRQTDAIVPLMCKTVEEVAQRAATLERSIRTRQVGESGSGESEEDVSRPSSSSEPRRSGAGSVPPAV
ncbi:hypothetical protein Taro_005199 [Colocasia esculenta]|uniref:Uncharacterized protein n=1 Tax=Colocasia esculenta TaxID=4460 RepID=A0A843TX67_COLES|nr:hypothetical protein [Colocasia esculenta]